jgi:hypothetical protein
MADKSTYWRNAVIDTMTTGGSGITAITPYVSLHTADPGLTGTSEVTGGSYARQTVAFSSASSGATANTGAVTFTDMPSATITHVGLWDSVSGGNFLYGDVLTNGSQIVNSGGSFEFPIGDLDLSES